MTLKDGLILLTFSLADYREVEHTISQISLPLPRYCRVLHYRYRSITVILSPFTAVGYRFPHYRVTL